MSKIVRALYNDDDILMDAVKAVKSKEYHIEEVFTPFPVHGLDKAMGLKPTRLAITSFLYGLTGLLFAIWMTKYMMIEDWPQDIGGKPNGSYGENVLGWITILFEMTVFFAAHLMVITFYMRSRLWPFKEAENPDVRTTDDHFLMEVVAKDDEESLSSFLKETGAVEVSIVEAH